MRSNSASPRSKDWAAETIRPPRHSFQRNWFPLIPQAAMSMSGHTVLTFNVHKNGMITDLTIARPSTINGFNNAAYGAMVSSNPTIPLPPEYPADKAFFTVTFFYNESPP